MKTAIIAMAVFLQITTIFNAAGAHYCSDKDLQQIRASFDDSFKKYFFFCSTLYCYERSAMHGDTDAISSIIDLSDVGQQNAEFTEWHYELIARLFVNFPAKFFDLLLTKDKQTVDYGMDRLKMPFLVEREAISAAAQKIVGIAKYRELAEELITK